MSPLVQILSPVLEPAPSYAHVVASVVTRNLRTPAMEKDMLLSMPYPLLPLDQWDPNLDFLEIFALFSCSLSSMFTSVKAPNHTYTMHSAGKQPGYENAFGSICVPLWHEISAIEQRISPTITNTGFEVTTGCLGGSISMTPNNNHFWIRSLSLRTQQSSIESDDRSNLQYLGSPTRPTSSGLLGSGSSINPYSNKDVKKSSTSSFLKVFICVLLGS
ncbi:hypothetical protein ACOSQ3_028732 [Xanthoceras sorbifolium]